VLAMGGFLMLIEAFRKGISSDTKVVLLILAIFLSVEGAGIILGYFLFAGFLGIFRKD
jgi:hypothetical protein